MNSPHGYGRLLEKMAAAYKVLIASCPSVRWFIRGDVDSKLPLDCSPPYALPDVLIDSDVLSGPGTTTAAFLCNTFVNLAQSPFRRLPNRSAWRPPDLGMLCVFGEDAL